jgi:hypothetical protein
LVAEAVVAKVPQVAVVVVLVVMFQPLVVVDLADQDLVVALVVTVSLDSLLLKSLTISQLDHTLDTIYNDTEYIIGIWRCQVENWHTKLPKTP